MTPSLQINRGDHVQVVMAGELDGCEGTVRRVIYGNIERSAVVKITSKIHKGTRTLPASCLRRL